MSTKVFEKKRVCILGAGSYGTAMAFVCARQGHDVVLWMRKKEVAAKMQASRYNPKRFSEQKLPDSVECVADVARAMKSSDLIIHCIPAQHTPKFVESIAHLIPTGVPYVSTAKGIHVESKLLMSEALPKALGEHRSRVALAYLSGPSFAKEMVKGHPVGVVVASYPMGDGTSEPTPETARAVQRMLNSKHFRIYVSTDVLGVEVGGALKNPLAIGAGMAIGSGFGQSTVAGIITRGCREMRILAIALGGKAETLAGLSGIGDLMLTCFSSLSRNNRCGQALAKGKSVAEIVEEMGEVIEGVPTASVVCELARRHNLRLPLFQAVDAIISGRMKAQDAFEVLMRGEPGEETFA